MSMLMRYLLACLLLWPTLAMAKGPTWEPSKTYAFLASVVEWEDSDLAPFTRERLDHDLVETLIAAGVPRENVTFLTDEKATLAAVRAGLKATAQKAGAGSTLIFYFQGHGLRERGKTTLAVYDIVTEKADSTGLAVAEVGAILEKHWKGERLILLGDACHSGGLGEVAQMVEKSRPGVKTAAITSAMVSNRSTTFWTFTESLIAAFGGEPILDRDSSGNITFSEVERFVADEMKYAERQLTGTVRGQLFEADFVFRSVPVKNKVAKEGPWKVGDYVQALDREGIWYGARVVEVRPGGWKVHYPGWDPKWDEWVDKSRIRPISQGKLEVGKRYEVEWRKGEWFEATVMRGLDDYFWYVHYSGEAGDDDEWVTADRVRPLSGKSRSAPKYVAATPRPFKVGDSVAAQWKTEWFLATLKARTPEGLWRVRYADDTDGTLIDEELIGLADKVVPGDRVLASWEGKPKMYEGVVLSVERNAARIKWDDGSAPSSVVLAQIAVVKPNK
jgi:hypothetical protein